MTQNARVFIGSPLIAAAMVVVAFAPAGVGCDEAAPAPSAESTAVVETAGANESDRPSASDSRIRSSGVSDEPLTAAPGSGERVVALKVDGMTCAGCASTINTSVADIEGVEETRVSLSRGVVWARLSPASDLSPSALADAINTTGYEARPLETSDENAAGVASPSPGAADDDPSSDDH